MDEPRRWLYASGVGFLVFIGLFVVGLIEHRRVAGEGDIWFFWSAAALVVSALFFEVAFTIYHIYHAHQETRRLLLEKFADGEVE